MKESELLKPFIPISGPGVVVPLPVLLKNWASIVWLLFKVLVLFLLSCSWSSMSHSSTILPSRTSPENNKRKLFICDFTWRNDASVTALNVDAIEWEVLLAKMISSFALIYVNASGSGGIGLESRETLTVEPSEGICTGSLVAANERILRALIDIATLDEFSADDDCIEAFLAFADERTVCVGASCSDCWAVTIN